MGIQIKGNSGTVAEILANTRAMLQTARAHDVGALGAYSMGQASAIMAAGLSSASPICSLRYSGSNVLVVRRLTFCMGGLGTAFAAGQAIFNLFAARSFSASDTGGGAATLTTNNGKLRTAFATIGALDFRISSTATLSAGTRTKDATPLKTLSFGIGTVASTIYVPPNTDLLPARGPSEWPLVLATNEGLVLEATVPATGTWCFSLDADVEELASF